MSTCCGTKSIPRILHDMRKSTADEQDERPEYLKLWIKQRTKKDGSGWVDKEAEAAYKEMEELHNAQVKEFGADNLTTVEAYTKVLGHRSGYARGMGEGPPPLKRVNNFGEHMSHTCVDEASINARIQAGVNKQLAEYSKKKEEEMTQRFTEFSEKREEEIRKQVANEIEDKLRGEFMAQIRMLMNEKTSSHESQTSPIKQSSNPPNASKRASLDKRQPKTVYNCKSCEDTFVDTEAYMVHLRSDEHHRRIAIVNKKVALPSTINIQPTKRKIKKEK